MASSILAKMAVQISANTAEFTKAMNNAQSGLKGFTSSLSGIAGALGVAFSAKAVGDFALEVSKLAGEAEGVKAAFDRLENSVQLMIDLKKATNGTVSELDLMKRAVMASNFDISLKALPKLLEFATLRAQQTGQSVDYLVDSIVTGIGRKSKLILDNLGISAVQLDEALGGASTAASSIGEVADAVGRIAEKNLKNMAGFSENAKTSMDRLSASWENLKVTMGQALNESGITQAGASSVSKLFDVLSSGMTTTQKLAVVTQAAINPIGVLTGQYDAFFDKVLKGLEKVEDHQYRLSKWDAQQLINKYGGINGAIEAMNSNALMFENNGGRLIENKTQILGILNQRLKESMDSVTRGLGEEATSAKKAAEAYEELFKSKANLDFKKDIVPNVSNVLIESRPKNIEGTESFMPEQVNIPTELQSQVDGIKAMYKTISEENAKLAQSFADLATTLFESVGNSIGSGENLGRGLLKALARFGVQYGAQLIAIGAAKIAEGIVTENPKAVSAGIFAVAKGGALVVASSALGGAMSRGQSSSGGGSYYDRRPSVSSNFQGSASSYQVDFKIRGSDLVGAMQAAQSDIRIRKGG